MRMRIMRSMDIPAEAKSLEVRVKEAGLRIQPILDEAQLDRSTWTRWKQGALTPRLDTWMAVQTAANNALSTRIIPPAPNPTAGAS